MNSTKNKQPNAKAFLLIGPPSGGKTSLALCFPSPWIGDADLNLDGPLRFLVKDKPDFDCFYDTISFKEGVEVAPKDRWNRCLDVVREALKDVRVKTAIVDSLTHLDQYLVDYVAKGDIRNLSQEEWIPFRTEMTRLLNLYRHATKTTIITCHEKIIPNRDGTIHKLLPAFRSRIGDFFGSFFTEILRCTSIAVGPTVKFQINTISDGRSDLKNSVGLPAQIGPASPQENFKKLNEYYKFV